MPYRQLADAGAQSTCASPITNSQTTVTLVSASGFPALLAGGQLSVIILDSGNLAFSAVNPLATNYEYQPINNITGNVLTFGPGGGGASRAAYAGTTPKAYSAGATIAVISLAEDYQASAPWKFAEQTPSSGSSFSQNVPSGFNAIDIIYSFSCSVANTSLLLQLNGDGGSHYYWAHNNAGSDGSRAGNGANAATTAEVGFVGSGGNLDTAGSIRLKDVQQTARHIRWMYEAAYDNSSAPNFNSLTGHGLWQATSLAALTSITLSLSGGAFTSSRFEFIGIP